MPVFDGLHIYTYTYTFTYRYTYTYTYTYKYIYIFLCQFMYSFSFVVFFLNKICIGNSMQFLKVFISSVCILYSSRDKVFLVWQKCDIHHLLLSRPSKCPKFFTIMILGETSLRQKEHKFCLN